MNLPAPINDAPRTGRARPCPRGSGGCVAPGAQRQAARARTLLLLLAIGLSPPAFAQGTGTATYVEGDSTWTITGPTEVTEGTDAIYTLSRTAGTATTLGVRIGVLEGRSDFRWAFNDGACRAGDACLRFPSHLPFASTGTWHEYQPAMPDGHKITVVVRQDNEVDHGDTFEIGFNPGNPAGNLFSVMIVNGDRPGTVTISQPRRPAFPPPERPNESDRPGPPVWDLGKTLTAALTDPDGVTSDVRWQWQRNTDTGLGGDWADIEGATLSVYTLLPDDMETGLRAQASYDDNDESGKSAHHPGRPVQGICGRTLEVYDALRNAVPGNPRCDRVLLSHLAEIGRDSHPYLNPLPFQNRPTSLMPYDFYGLTGLRGLTISSNTRAKLTSLPPNAFIGLENLQALNLFGNALTALEPESLNGLDLLEELYLNGNRLTGLAEGALVSVPNLRMLGLQNNRITMLVTGTLEDVPMLERLDLYRNRLTSVPADALDEIDGLRDLDLRRNNISSLPEDLFTGHSSLRVVRLNLNPGAPFTLAVTLARNDDMPWTTAGAATVSVSIREGTPRPISVTLGSADGLSTETLVIPAGGDASPTAVVTPSDSSDPARVFIESLPNIVDRDLCLDPNVYCSVGLDLASGNPVLALPTTAVDRQEWTAGLAASLRLPKPVGGDGELTYGVSPDLPEGMALSGRDVSGTPVTSVPERTHTWTVTDASGNSVALDFTVTVAAGVPAAPQDLTATAGVEETTLGWTAGRDHGSAILSWQIRSSTDGGSTWTEWADIPGSGADTDSHIAAAPAGTVHVFEVRARNDVGPGPQAQVTAPMSVPNSIPTFGGAAVASQAWKVGTPVSLALPEAVGGNAPLIYEFLPTLPPGLGLSGRDVTGTPTSVTPVTQVSWVVTDRNGDVVSVDFSVEVAAGEPGVPQNLRTESGHDRQAPLSWIAGADNGASIDYWQARVSADNGATWTDWELIPGGGTATTHTVTGLVAGIPHIIEVRAHNSAGFGDAARAAATPTEVDTDPTFGGATVEDQTWTVGTEVDLALPEVTEGNLPYTYEINPQLPDGVGLSERTVSGTPTQTSSGQTHTLTVTDRAVSAGDQDQISLEFEVVVNADVPDAPTGLQASAGVEQAELRWTAGSNNGSSVTLWQYRVSADGGNSWVPDWTDITPSDADTTVHTVTGLAANIEHTFEVRAQNSVGVGEAASATTTPMEPDVEPTFGEATVGDQTWTVGVEVNLDLPEATGGNGELSHSLMPALPAGVTLDGNSVSGTPDGTAAATTYEWVATDGDGDTVTVSFMVTVDPNVPGPPRNLRATSDAPDVGLSWEAGPDNGASVTLWEYRVSNDGGNEWSPDWTEIPGSGEDTSSHTVQGLDANIAYTFEVRALNSAGEGDSASVTLDTEPTFGDAGIESQLWKVGTPVNLELPEATGGNGELALVFDGTLPGGVARDGMRISGTPTTPTPTRQFSWTATDEDDDSVVLEFMVTVEPDVPAIPTDLQATAGTLEVELRWTAGPDNGAAIDLWQYRVSIDGGTTWSPDWTDIPSSGAGTSIHTVANLSANVEHTFEVRAHNSEGHGPPSAQASATPVERDVAPTFNGASVTDRVWLVGTAASLTLPEATGGNGALTYTLTPTLPAGMSRTDREISGTPAAPAAATEHTWTVTDGDGDSVTLKFMITVDPDVPGAPTNLAATAGEGTADLRWEAGPDNGADITTWQYRSSGDGGANWSVWTDIPSSDADTREHMVTGLVANTEYTFEVRAQNSAGDGDAASVVLNVEPTFGGASIPGQTWKIGTAASLELPEATGGNGDLSYELAPDLPMGMSRTGRGISGTPTVPVAATEHTWTVTDGDGDSAELKFMVTVEADVPGAPTNLRATAGNGTAGLAWETGPDNGATVTAWQYRSSEDGTTWSDWTAIPSSDADTREHTVTGLVANREYTLEVRAQNSEGDGPAASVVLDVGPTFGGESVTDQTWTVGTAAGLELPAATGGNGDLEYTLTPELPAGMTRNGRTVSGTPKAASASQQFTWTATDDDGDQATLLFSILIEADTPEAPTSLLATPGTVAVELRWTAGSDNGAAIDLWQYRQSTDGGTIWSPDWTAIPSSDASTTVHTITGLEAGTSHTFEVRARNSKGFGPQSGQASAIPLEINVAPAFGGAVVADQVWLVGTAVSLELPEATGGNGVLSYELTPTLPAGMTRTGRDISGTPAATAAATEHTWTVTDGDGDDAELKFMVTVEPDVPDAPMNLQATAGGESAELTWGAGPNNGAAVTRWQYRSSEDGTTWSAWANIPGSDADTRAHTVTGLVANTEYTFEVRAQNSAGDGDAASVVLNVEPTFGGASIPGQTWKIGTAASLGLPGATGGNGDLSYELTPDLPMGMSRTGRGISGTPTVPVAATQHTWTVTDGDGDSAELKFMVTVEADVPGAPTNLRATAGDGTAELMWEAGPENGAAVTRWQYRSSEDGTTWSAWADIQSSDADTREHTVTGLVANREYTFEVRAQNSEGDGPAASVVLDVGPTFGGESVTDQVWTVGTEADLNLPAATGGNGDLEHTLTPKLPAGMTRVGRNVSGTPTAAAADTEYVWAATDDDTDRAALTFSILVEADRPEAPTNLLATPGTVAVELRWTTGSDNGAAIDLWQYRQSDDGGTTWPAGWISVPSSDADTTVHTITGLDAGTSYTFEVRAHNSAGFSAPSAPASAIPLEVDVAPTFGSASVADLVWLVGTAASLTLPEATGGNGELMYALTPDLPAGMSRTGRSISGTPTATASATEHTWTVTDGDGDGAQLKFMVTVDPDAPDAPMNLQATAGEGSAELMWEAGPDNGAPVTTWQYRSSDDGGVNWSDWAGIPSSDAGTREHLVTGLVANTEYTLEVRAQNSAGDGDAASVVLDVEPTFGGASILGQDWTVDRAASLVLPEASGGNGDLSYELTPELPMGMSRTGREISGTPTGPVPATQHAWTATDADGDSAELLFSIMVNPDVPGAPTNLQATAGDGTAELTWEAGPDNGAAVTLWQYRSRAAGAAAWSAWVDMLPSGADTRSHTVTDLEADTEHTFEVRAQNMVGPGQAGSVVLDVAPTFGGANVPDQTWTVGAAAELTLPAAGGGNGMLAYTLEPGLPDGMSRAGREISGTPAAAAAQQYVWAATDSDMDRAALTFSITVEADRPEEPVNLQATPRTVAVELRWEAGSDNGAAVDLWQYRQSEDGGTTWPAGWIPVPSSDANTTVHTITGLDAGTRYTFEVRARNAVGFGDPSAPASAIPLEVDVAPAFGDAVADQVWLVGTAASLTLPDATGGNGELTYTLEPPLPAGMSRTGREISGTPAGPVPATRHTWTATDGDDDSVTLEFMVTVDPDVPGAPTNLAATAGEGTADLRWEAGPDNGAPVTTWQYRESDDGGANWSAWAGIPSSDAGTREHTVTGLVANTEYTFEVRAQNSAGDGDAASVVLDVEPTFGGASILGQDWTVGRAASLVLPEATGGNGVLTYTLEPELPADVVRSGQIVSGIPTVTIAEAQFIWTATDGDGDSVKLSFSIMVNPDVPGAPTDLQATAGDGTAELTWEAGPDNGAAVTLWQYRSRAAGAAAWSAWTDMLPSDADTRSHTVTDLEANTEHTFEVRAQNMVGPGQAGSVVLDVAPTFGGASVPDQSWTVGAAAELRLPAAAGGNGMLAYMLEPDLPAGMGLAGRDVSGAPTAAAAAQQYVWTATDNDMDRAALTFSITVEAAAPGAPANLRATAGTLAAELRWEAGPDNGAAIDLWQYRVSTDGGATWSPDWTAIPSSDANTTVHTITGLEANIGHTFEVRARNSAGFGPASSATATPIEPDVVPSFGSAGVADRTWLVGTAASLTLPEAVGGNGVLAYTLEPDLPAGMSRAGREISGTPTAPAAARQYVWTAADADMDEATVTFSITVEPDAPDAPRNLRATANAQEAELRWEAGPDNGAPVTLWQYRVSADGGASWSAWTDIPASGADTDGHTVTGLPANIEHTFELRAQNSAGDGNAASVVLDVEPTFGDAGVSDRTWLVGTAASLTLPEAVGGNGVLAYTLEPGLPAGMSRAGREISGTPAAPAAARQYVWTAADAGMDEATVTFSITVEADAPEAPRNLRATANAQEAELRWEAGPDNGAPVTLWQYRSSTDGGAGWSAWTGIPASNADTTVHTVTGLPANIEHTFEVRARNSAGPGDAASVVLDVAPTFGDAGVSDQAWLVGTAASLTLPEAVGGNGVLAYTLEPGLPAGMSRTGREISGTPDAPAAERQYVWTATDADMDEATVTFTVAVEADAPGAPRNLRATSGAPEVALQWEAGPDNGAAIDLWQYRVSADGGATWSPDWADIPSSNADTAGHTVPGLEAYVAYIFEVRARNSAGDGAAAAVTLDVEPAFGGAGVPEQLWKVGTAVDLMLPEASGGNGVLAYSLVPKLPAGVVRSGRRISGTPTEPVAGRLHSWRATDEDMDSVALAFMVTVDPDVPGAPVGLRATAGAGEAELRWEAGPDNGADITLWQYRASTDEGVSWAPDWTDIPSSDANTTVHTVAGLPANIEHTFQVRALNSAGPGLAAETGLDVEPTFGGAGVPDQVWKVGSAYSLELPEATGGNGDLVYAFGPELPAGVARTGRDISGTPTGPVAATRHTWAVTDDDRDRAELAFTVTVEPDVPGAPVGLQATAGTVQAVLRWGAGPDNGAAITLWQYRVSTDGGLNWSPDWTDIPSSGADTTAHTVTGLPANIGHTFEVRAQNSAGAGPASSATATPVEVDTEPTFGGATVDDQEWTVGTGLEMVLPEATGGNGSLSHALSPALPAGVSLEGRVVSGTPTEVVAGQTHTWTASDREGDRATLEFSVAVTAGTPAAPASFTLERGYGRVTMRWAPGEENGAPVEQWQYRMSSDNGATWNPGWTDIEIADGETTHVLSGLDGLTAHIIEVRAQNSAGDGDPVRETVIPMVNPDVDRDGDYDHTDSLLGFYSLRFGNFLLANTRLLDLVFGRLVGSEYRSEHGPQIISRSRRLGEDTVYTTLDMDEDGDVDHGDLLLAFYSLRFGNFLLANTRLLNLVYSRIVTGDFPEGFGERIIGNARRLEQDHADKTPGN